MTEYKLKILHVGPVYSNRSSGPSHSILGLAGGQSRNGCTVGLLPSIPPGISKEMMPKGIKLLPSPKAVHLNPWKVSKKWIKVIIETFGKPDIINFHDTYIPFQIALAELFRREGWPYIVTPRGGLTRLAQNKKLLKKKLGNILFFRRFLRNARAIHALSENEAVDIKFFYPCAKTFVVPNGIDEDLLSLTLRSGVRELKGFREDGDLLIGFIGRIDIYHKGIDLVLLAIKLLQDKGLGQKIKFVMVGPFYTTEDERRVKRFINSLKFPDKIMHTGPLYGEVKWNFLKECDVFIHASRFEGMPMAVLEAIALEKPCIVTPGTNVQDIISLCNGGWLCDDSVDSIAKAILQVEKERDEILERGINAKNYVKEHLTWPIVAQQWLRKAGKIAK